MSDRNRREQEKLNDRLLKLSRQLRLISLQLERLQFDTSENSEQQHPSPARRELFNTPAASAVAAPPPSTAATISRQHSVHQRTTSTSVKPSDFVEGDFVVITNKYKGLLGAKGTIVDVTPKQVSVRLEGTRGKIVIKSKTNVRKISR